MKENQDTSILNLNDLFIAKEKGPAEPTPQDGAHVAFFKAAPLLRKGTAGPPNPM
jgi:hypothetical protein